MDHPQTLSSLLEPGSAPSPSPAAMPRLHLVSTGSDSSALALPMLLALAAHLLFPPAPRRPPGALLLLPAGAAPAHLLGLLRRLAAPRALPPAAAAAPRVLPAFAHPPPPPRARAAAAGGGGAGEGGGLAVVESLEEAGWELVSWLRARGWTVVAASWTRPPPPAPPAGGGAEPAEEWAWAAATVVEVGELERGRMREADGWVRIWKRGGCWVREREREKVLFKMGDSKIQFGSLL